MIPVLPAVDIFIIAGEPSGDAYAATIVTALRSRQPSLRIAGAGCEHLRATGIDIDVAMDAYAVMGFVAVIKRLPEFRRLGRDLAGIIRSRQPRLIITIDYPGFNLRLLHRLRDLQAEGCRFCHVVAPQVWAWKPQRAPRVAALVHQLLCFFPFEPRLFTRHGGRASFIGHPLLDAVADPKDVPQPHIDTLRREWSLQPGDRLLLLAPGSREQEVSRLLPVFDEAVAMIGHRLRCPGRLCPVIAKAPHLDYALYRRLSHFPIIDGRYRELLQCAHAGMIASGTASLEAALAGCLHVITYKADHLTATLGRHLIRTPHVGLPNIVLGRRVCPELLQDECNPVRLAAHMQAIWQGPRRDRCLEDLRTLRQRLGQPGALDRAAEEILHQFPAAAKAANTNY